MRCSLVAVRGAGKPPTACSKACATRSTVASSKCLPTIIIPTGSPSASPAGTEQAGCPLTSNGAVFPIISSPRARISSRGAPGPGSGVARTGSVGMTSTSNRASASS